MTLKAGVNGAIYLAQYDLSGAANKFTVTPSRALIDGTCFGAGGRTYHPGLHDDSFSMDCFYDFPADIGTELKALRTATTVHVCSLCLGTTQEEKAIAGEGAFLLDMPIDTPVDGLIRVSASFKFQGLMRTGYVLQASAEQTENGSGDIVDDSAASSAGAEAYLHVFSCDVPDLVIKVQTDTLVGFASPTDLITFTTVTGATSERKVVTSDVEEFVRINWSGTWTGSKKATFAVIWARP